MIGSTQPNLYVSGLCVRIPSAPLHPGHPTKGQLVLVRSPRTELFLCLHLGRMEEQPPLTLLAAVSLRVGIVEISKLLLLYNCNLLQLPPTKFGRKKTSTLRSLVREHESHHDHHHDFDWADSD